MTLRRETLLRAAIVVAALFLFWALRTVLGPLLLSYLFALVLVPLFERFARRIGRPLAAAATVLVMVLAPLLLAAVCWFSAASLGKYFDGARVNELATAVNEQVRQTYLALPESIRTHIQESQRVVAAEEEAAEEEAAGEGTDGAGADGTQAGDAAAATGIDAETDAVLRSFGTEAMIEGVRAYGPRMVQSFVDFFGGVFGILSITVLIPVFVFFLLLGVPWVPRVRAEIPPDWHPQFDRIVPRIQDILRLYVSSRLQVAFWKGMLGFLFLMLLGFPGSFALGLLIGVFSLIPVLGPIVALLPLALVAFVDGGYTGGHILGVLVALSLYGMLELFEGYVLLPRIVGRKLAMSDFAVILAAMCGGALMGIFGLVIAIPALAVFKVLYDEFVRPILKTQRGDRKDADGAAAADADAAAEGAGG